MCATLSRLAARPRTTGMSRGQVRVALVTGANRGMGLETCRQLLDRGLRVVMTGRDERATRKALEGLGAAPDRALALAMDVSDAASVTAAARAASERFGAVD